MHACTVHISLSVCVSHRLFLHFFLLLLPLSVHEFKCSMYRRKQNAYNKNNNNGNHIKKTGSNDKPDIQRKCRGSIVVLVRFSINCIFDTWRQQQQQVRRKKRNWLRKHDILLNKFISYFYFNKSIFARFVHSHSRFHCALTFFTVTVVCAAARQYASCKCVQIYEIKTITRHQFITVDMMTEIYHLHDWHLRGKGESARSWKKQPDGISSNCLQKKKRSD